MSIKPNRIEIEHYYDSQQVEGEELTQSFAHYVAIQYLIAVLEWLFNGKEVGIVSSVNFYQIEHQNDPPKSPDIAVVEGLVPDERSSEDNPSYWIGEDGPPPLVVFEIASKETWLNDLETKPKSYADMGIPEYFAFDPNEPSVWTGTWREEARLIGWRLDSGQYHTIEKDAAGRLWSEQLQSWLKVEGKHLKLYTREGELRLTSLETQTQRTALERARAEAQTRRAEAQAQQAAMERARAEAQARRAEAQAQQAAMERARAEAQAQQAEAAEQQAAMERARAEAQAQRAEAAEQQVAMERARAEAQAQQAAMERARMEKLIELLRQKGINPDDLI
jgi:Uma2 family endonuclease